jgi:hypothetical protein
VLRAPPLHRLIDVPFNPQVQCQQKTSHLNTLWMDAASPETVPDSVEYVKISGNIEG